MRTSNRAPGPAASPAPQPRTAGRGRARASPSTAAGGNPRPTQVSGRRYPDEAAANPAARTRGAIPGPRRVLPQSRAGPTWRGSGRGARAPRCTPRPRRGLQGDRCQYFLIICNINLPISHCLPMPAACLCWGCCSSLQRTSHSSSSRRRSASSQMRPHYSW